MTASGVVGSATLLPDGRVLLIEGGKAELYDPSTGSVTATGSMIDGSGRAATLLTNGKVLISGLFKPELYDPSTGMFTIAGPYASAYTHEDAFETTATLLPSGEVLFAADVQYVRNYGAELYDSTTNTFRLTGAMVNYFNGRTTNLLVNGKVLRAGGTDDFGRYQKAEQYDPATGKFTATGDMTTPRSDHAAVLLPDGALHPSAEIVDICLESVDALKKFLYNQWPDEATLQSSAKSLLTRIARLAPEEVEAGAEPAAPAVAAEPAAISAQASGTAESVEARVAQASSPVLETAPAEIPVAGGPRAVAQKTEEPKDEEIVVPARRGEPTALPQSKSVRIALERLDQMMNAMRTDFDCGSA